MIPYRTTVLAIRLILSDIWIELGELSTAIAHYPFLGHFSKLSLALLDDVHPDLHSELFLFFGENHRFFFFRALGCGWPGLLSPEFDAISS